MANKALDFDGASGLGTVADAAAIQNIFDDGGTVECWINVDSDGEADQGRIVSKVWIFDTLGESGEAVQLRVYVPFSGDDGSWNTTSRIVDINTWYHVVATYNSNAVANNPIIYVNGTAYTVGDGLTEAQAPTGTRTTDVGTDLIIGNIAGDNRTFDGTIDEMRLYKRILGQTEVTANYNGGAGRYWPSDFRDLVAWWHMDEGSGLYIYDRTNRGNTGTITSASWVDGFDFLIQKNIPRRK